MQSTDSSMGTGAGCEVRGNGIGVEEGESGGQIRE